MENNILVEFSESQKLKQEFQRYLSFWPYFLISLFIFAFLGYIYLRYADYKYTSSAIIEIVDEAQNTEMSLPSAMTIFNRSMINLEN